MYHGYYKLKGRIPVKCTLEEFAKQYEDDSRIVESDKLADGTRVSTVFLGIDHRFNGKDDDPPIIFETMIFGSSDPALEDYQERYITYTQAERGHKRALHLAVQAELNNKLN